MEELEKKARSFKPDLLLGVNRGGAIIGGLLAKRLKERGIALLDVPDPAGPVSLATIEWMPPNPPKILIVDDASHTGGHMRRAKDFVETEYPGVDVKCGVLLLVEQNPSAHGAPASPVDFAAYRTKRATTQLPWYPD